MKKTTKKLVLTKETVGLLISPAELAMVVGGQTEGCTFGCSCPRGDLSECPGPA